MGARRETTASDECDRSRRLGVRRIMGNSVNSRFGDNLTGLEFLGHRASLGKYFLIQRPAQRWRKFVTALPLYLRFETCHTASLTEVIRANEMVAKTVHSRGKFSPRSFVTV
jgi:hypothetical protein